MAKPIIIPPNAEPVKDFSDKASVWIVYTGDYDMRSNLCACPSEDIAESIADLHNFTAFDYNKAGVEELFFITNPNTEL